MSPLVVLEADLNLEPNEASDLTPLFRPEVLAERGWDRAFATVLDEVPVERAVAVIVHDAGAPAGEGWHASRVPTRPSRRAGKTDDSEACAVRDGRLYVAGSQYGGKSGPLEPARSFVARLGEEDLLAALEGGEPARLEVAWLRFSLHRAINDALAAAGVELRPLGPRTREAFIDATIRGAAADDKRWSGRVTSADQPINVEAVSFRPDGRMLIGLRHPVTAEGHPLMVELEDVDELFAEPDEVPACSPVWWLEDAGRREEPAGLRALHAAGEDRYEAVVGNLDSTGKGSVLVEDHPEAGAARSSHVRFSLPLAAGGGAVSCERVRDLEEHRRVEGLAVDAAGATFYVVDREGHVALRALGVG